VTSARDESSGRPVFFLTYAYHPDTAGGVPRIRNFSRALSSVFDTVVFTRIHSGVKGGYGSEVVVRSRDLLARGSGSRGQGAKAPGALRALSNWLFPDRHFAWIAPVVWRAMVQSYRVGRPVAVITTYGPASNVLAALIISRLLRVPLVLDFRDLYATLPFAKFPTRIHRRLAHILEAAAVRRASLITAVSDAMLETIAQVHRQDLTEEKWLAIPNGFDPAHVQYVRDLRTPSESRPFSLYYTGSAYGGYDFEPLAGGLSRLVTSESLTPDDFRLVMVGGQFPSDLLKKFDLGQYVEHLPYCSHEEVFEHLGRADALVVVEGQGYWAKYGFPVKVFDYILSGKPIVGVLNQGGNTSKLLSQIGRATVASSDDETGIDQALRKMISLKNAPMAVIEVSRRPFSDFSRDNQSRQFVEKVSKMLSIA
jgi:hypothetical protein